MIYSHRFSIACCTIALTGLLLAGASSAQNGTPDGTPGQGVMGQKVPGSLPPSGQAFDLAVPKAPDPTSVVRGKALYTSNCSFCHGASATGGDSGPSLVRSVLVLHDHGSGEILDQFLSVGRPQKGMPKFSFGADQGKDLAAFLSSRIIAAADRRQYVKPDIVVGNLQAGAQLFQARCGSCHSATEDLNHVGTKYETEKLQERMLVPDVSKTVTVTDENGQKHSGTLLSIDDFNVSLLDQNGGYHSWSLAPTGRRIQVSVEDPASAHLKMLGQIPDSEIRDLVAFLSSLK